MTLDLDIDMVSRVHAFGKRGLPRRVFSLFPQSNSGNPSTGCRLWGTSSGWTFTQTNGTVTVNGDMLVCESTASACRAFASRDVNFTNGRYYCVSVEIAAFAKSAANALIDNITTTTVPTWGDRNFAFGANTPEIGQRYGVILKAGSTAAHSIRFGIGVNAGQTISSGRVMIAFRNPMIHEIADPASMLTRANNDGSSAASVYAPSTFFGPAEYVPAADLAGFNYDNNSTLENGTNGKVIFKPGVPFDVEPMTIGGVVGHSFATDESDWPHQLRLRLPECAIRYRGFTGGLLTNPAQIPAMIEDIIAPRELDARALPLGWLIVNAGINDIFAGTLASNPVPALVEAFQATAKRIVAANILPMFCNITPASGWVSYNEAAGHENYIQQTNQFLRKFCSENQYPLIDMHRMLRDPATPTQLLAAYTSDSLHPNAVGGRLIASRVGMMIQNLARETVFINN